jgi:hypothetical protein
MSSGVDTRSRRHRWHARCHALHRLRVAAGQGPGDYEVGTRNIRFDGAEDIMTVSQVMSPDVVCVAPDTTTDEARVLLVARAMLEALVDARVLAKGESGYVRFFPPAARRSFVGRGISIPPIRPAA